MSGIRIDGMDELLAELDKRYGKEAMEIKVDQALKKGAEVFESELKREFAKFKDTGASIYEITVSEPLDYGGKRTIRVHWKGPKSRYRIIHLNEFGTVQNPNPPGKGAVARAERSAREAYQRVIREELGRG
ncbi:HK97-gp10 family putative phage morphogenesis protein [Bacillus sp. FJAT-45037]|uniref:HK97-gp10 family putative phage morphogenesis protein n=1 Tax=Bacillus sp. FJAT-45037 TaxID=2011007 RepID=UPI000C23B657|nr:HK97-gp10 family putative phage morphogenesis protein [Bacillus sp. FJAT-45037]